MKRYQLRIGGQAVDPQGSAWFETQNPYTGTTWAEIPRGYARDVDAAVRAAHRALTDGVQPRLIAQCRDQELQSLPEGVGTEVLQARLRACFVEQVVHRTEA